MIHITLLSFISVILIVVQLLIYSCYKYQQQQILYAFTEIVNASDRIIFLSQAKEKREKRHKANRNHPYGNFVYFSEETRTLEPLHC